MSEGVQPSTRVTTGVFMLVAGVVLGVMSIFLLGMLSYLAIIPMLAAPILALTGIFQMVRGVRERAGDGGSVSRE